MSAKTKKSTATDSDLMETNKKLSAALRDAEAALKCCGQAFGQLGALFRVTDKNDVRVDDLLTLGRNVADDWENNAYCFRLDIEQALGKQEQRA